MQRPGEEGQGAPPVTLGPNYDVGDLLNHNIANLLARYGLTPKPEEKKVKPIGARTPQEKEADILTAALETLGIDLSDPDFIAFEKWLSAKFGIDSYRGRFKGTWEQYVKTQAKQPVTAPSTLAREVERAPYVVGRAPLEDQLQNWKEEQAALREATTLEERRNRLAAEMEDQRKFQDDLTNANLKDAVATLQRRYPGNKNLFALPQVQTALRQEWALANAKAQADLEALPPELQGAIGQTGAGVDIGTFARSLDWPKFTAQHGLGDNWQDGMLQDALQRQVFDPMLAAAKTPQDKLAAENKIANLQKSYAGLLRSFNFAQQQDLTLTADAWVADEGGAIVAQMQANNQVWLAEQIKTLAGEGKSRAQIAAQLTLGPADFVSSAEALRQGENLAELIKKAKVLQQNQENRAAAQAYAAAISQLDPRSLESPEDMARRLGTSLSALQAIQGALGPNFSFVEHMQQRLEQNRLYNQFQAGERRDLANVDATLKPAVDAGVITDQATLDAYRSAMLSSPTDFVRYSEDLKQATDAARQGQMQARRAQQEAQGAATGVQANAAYVLAAFPRSAAEALDLERNLGAASEEARASGTATQAQLDELAGARLFQREGFPEYFQANAGQFAADYAKALSGRAYLTGTSALPSNLSNVQTYVRSQLPQIGRQFEGYQQQQALASLKPALDDKGFAPTVTQLLTDFGLRSPGVSRNDLLSRNATAIQKTYDEYLRRSSGQQGQGSFSLAQQRQAIASGIL